MLGFIAGYLYESFELTVGITFAGAAVAALLGVPDWPYLNKAPLKFGVYKKKLK